MIAITKEQTEALRKSRTVDWEKKSARPGMRRMVKRLLRKYKYPPEGMEDALKTGIWQCEMWTDYGEDYGHQEKYESQEYDYSGVSELMMAAEERAPYGE